MDGSEPPVLLLHGSLDTLVSPLQLARMYEKLKAEGADAEYELVKNAHHGDLPWYQDAVITKVVDFFNAKLGAFPSVKVDGTTL